MRFKNLTTFLALILFCTGALQAQEQNDNNRKKIIVIEKVIDNDGDITTETIELEGDAADEYLNNQSNINIDLSEGHQNVEVRVEENDGATQVWISDGTDEEVLEIEGEHEYHFIEGGADGDVHIYHIDEDVEIIKEELNEFLEENEDRKIDKKIIIKKQKQSDKALLESFDLGNIDVDDIRTLDITSKNGENRLDITLKDGKVIKKIRRDGQLDMGNMFHNNHFVHRSHNPCNEGPFLGISMQDIHEISTEEDLVARSTNGVEILNVTPASGAEAAGLKAGDVITNIDGQSILTHSDVSAVIKAHQVGDVISVSLTRGTENLSMSATLGKRKCREYGEFKHKYKGWKNDFKFERNPCKPLIGFFHEGRGAQDQIIVKSIVENTPAERKALQPGDQIISFDGIEVTSWKHLIELRDRHESGDRFKMVISRDGKQQKFKANFNDCPKDEVKDNIFEYDLPEDVVVAGSPIDVNVYPNPSQGQVTVEFAGDAAPLSIQISDISGKVLIDRSIENFDGQFKQEFDFSDAAEGTLLIRLQQGQDIITRQVVLQKLN